MGIERGVAGDEGVASDGARDAHSIGLLYVYVFLSRRQHPLSRPRKPEGVRACQRVLSPPPSTLFGRDAHRRSARVNVCEYWNI